MLDGPGQLSVMACSSCLEQDFSTLPSYVPAVTPLRCLLDCSKQPHGLSKLVAALYARASMSVLTSGCGEMDFEDFGGVRLDRHNPFRTHLWSNACPADSFRMPVGYEAPVLKAMGVKAPLNIYSIAPNTPQLVSIGCQKPSLGPKGGSDIPCLDQVSWSCTDQATRIHCGMSPVSCTWSDHCSICKVGRLDPFEDTQEFCLLPGCVGNGWLGEGVSTDLVWRASSQHRLPRDCLPSTAVQLKDRQILEWYTFTTCASFLDRMCHLDTLTKVRGKASQAFVVVPEVSTTPAKGEDGWLPPEKLTSFEDWVNFVPLFFDEHPPAAMSSLSCDEKMDIESEDPDKAVLSAVSVLTASALNPNWQNQLRLHGMYEGSPLIDNLAFAEGRSPKPHFDHFLAKLRGLTLDRTDGGESFGSVFRDVLKCFAKTNVWSKLTPSDAGMAASRSEVVASDVISGVGHLADASWYHLMLALYNNADLQPVLNAVYLCPLDGTAASLDNPKTGIYTTYQTHDKTGSCFVTAEGLSIWTVLMKFGALEFEPHLENGVGRRAVRITGPLPSLNYHTRQVVDVRGSSDPTLFFMQGLLHLSLVVFNDRVLNAFGRCLDEITDYDHMVRLRPYNNHPDPRRFSSIAHTLGPRAHALLVAYENENRDPGPMIWYQGLGHCVTDGKRNSSGFNPEFIDELNVFLRTFFWKVISRFGPTFYKHLGDINDFLFKRLIYPASADTLNFLHTTAYAQIPAHFRQEFLREQFDEFFANLCTKDNLNWTHRRELWHAHGHRTDLAQATIFLLKDSGFAQEVDPQGFLYRLCNYLEFLDLFPRFERQIFKSEQMPGTYNCSSVVITDLFGKLPFPHTYNGRLRWTGALPTAAVFEDEMRLLANSRSVRGRLLKNLVATHRPQSLCWASRAAFNCRFTHDGSLKEDEDQIFVNRNNNFTFHPGFDNMFLNSALSNFLKSPSRPVDDLLVETRAMDVLFIDTFRNVNPTGFFSSSTDALSGTRMLFRLLLVVGSENFYPSFSGSPFFSFEKGIMSVTDLANNLVHYQELPTPGRHSMRRPTGNSATVRRRGSMDYTPYKKPRKIRAELTTNPDEDSPVDYSPLDAPVDNVIWFEYIKNVLVMPLYLFRAFEPVGVEIGEPPSSNEEDDESMSEVF